MRFLLLFTVSTALFGQAAPIAAMDVEYSAVGQRVAMDIYRPADDAVHPAVLLVHGGGFRAGNRSSYTKLAVRLAQHGYVAATVSYRFAPQFPFPAAVHDVKAAVRFLRANAKQYHLDPDRIGAAGGSAGGHLVLFLGLTANVPEFEGTGPNKEFSSRVECVADYYGPSDFTQSYAKSVDAAVVLPMFLEGDLVHKRPEHIRASPLNWVTPDAAPILALHGTQDTYVAYEQSVWLLDRLLGAGVPAELETIPGAGHGFKGADADRADTRAIAWLDRWLMMSAAK